MLHGNALDLLNDDEKRNFFRGYLDTAPSKCSGDLRTGEITCYRIACHAPDMVQFMPDQVRRKIDSGFYANHLQECQDCALVYVIIENRSGIEFNSIPRKIN